MRLLIFYLGLGFLLTHELDAMVHAEWRLLYILRDMPEHQAQRYFLWLHVPLIASIVWLTHLSRDFLQGLFRYMFSIFLVIHAILHWRLSLSQGYPFTGLDSQFLIYGAGFFGALGMILPTKRSVAK